MKKLLYTITGLIALFLVVAMISSAVIWPTINVVETGATPEYADIQPQYYSTSPERIYEEIQAAVQALDSWEIVQADPRTRRIEAERTTRVFRFVDDITIQVEPVTEFVAQVHLRSASRVGKSDLGQNARNIEEFFEELDSRLGAVRFLPNGNGDEEDVQEEQVESQDSVDLE